MSKTILVMDMPKDCLHCQLRKVIHIDGKYYQHCGLDTNGYCLETFFKENDLKDGFKSEHCPLKEVPQKKEVCHTMGLELRTYTKGYNACIDEILEGSEESEPTENKEADTR
jgi:hypothetical protein